MKITSRNHYENTKLEIAKEFPEFSEKQVIHAANVVCNYLKRQCFDLWEVYISKGNYVTLDHGNFTYSNVVACKEIIYLTIRID